MRDSKLQRCIQQHKELKVIQKATNGDKHIHEAFKQTFAHNLSKLSFKYTQGKLFNWNICFDILNIRNYDQCFVFWANILKLSIEWRILTSQFDISSLQKQLGGVIQIHLDQCVNFRPLPLNVCLTRQDRTRQILFSCSVTIQWQSLKLIRIATG